MKFLTRLKHVFLGIVGRRFSFFSRGVVLDTNSPFFEGLSDREMKEIERQAKDVYQSDSVQKWLRSLDEARKNTVYGPITKIGYGSNCIEIHKFD